MATTGSTQRDFAALEARRMEAARLFARKVSQNEVARQLGVSVTAAHRWFHAWQARRRRGLKAAGLAGRKPRLDRAALAKVERALRQIEHSTRLRAVKRDTDGRSWLIVVEGEAS